MPGPSEIEFRRYLDGADHEQIDEGSAEWYRCAELLNVVAASMRQAAQRDHVIGGETGPAMGRSFVETARGLDERVQLLRDGSRALDRTAKAIREAREARRQMDVSSPELDKPGPYRRPVGPVTPEDVTEQRKHGESVKEYNDNLEARERISGEWTRRLDEVFGSELGDIKRIHGEQEPVRPPEQLPPTGPTGPGGGGPDAPVSRPPTSVPPGTPTSPPTSPPPGIPPGPPPGNPSQPGYPQGPTPGTPQGPGAPTSPIAPGAPAPPAPVGPTTPGSTTPMAPISPISPSAMPPSPGSAGAPGGVSPAAAAGIGAGGAAAGAAIGAGVRPGVVTPGTPAGARPI
ncbi:WXG100 family type VII secretion target, partial [Nocardioides dongxiaopingii]|uniref:WXG100 family type VII secretion target n=1 Tax=Nocardioides dongxiaopingii TaxID=2576036 RepID=UPI003CCC5364